ncbi:MAG: hypothetical protein O3C60_20535 [Planctomycetota bacterium]|nr:hypothetical protein [Planctomycetota bacterium]
MGDCQKEDLRVEFDSRLKLKFLIAWDGTALWVTAYDVTNNACRYTPTGTLLQTVLGFGNDRHGFEVAGNHLIANQGDGVGPYDLYELNGSLFLVSACHRAFAAKVQNKACPVRGTGSTSHNLTGSRGLCRGVSHWTDHPATGYIAIRWHAPHRDKLPLGLTQQP